MTKHLLFFCLLAALFSAIIFSCEKEQTAESDQTVIKPNKSINEIVWDDYEKQKWIDITSRSGIILNHIFHPVSWSTDSYLLNIPRIHRAYQHSAIDSIVYERINANDANLGGVIISNYDITIYYKSGFVDLLENYVVPTSYGNNFKQINCLYPINRSGCIDLHFIEFVKSDTMTSEQLPYRCFQQVKLIHWNVYTNFESTYTYKGLFKLFPESSKSLQFQPKHII